MSYRIYAGPASPYSHKVRAVFRYRRVPHTWLVPMGGFTGRANLGEGEQRETALQKAAKGVVPVVEYPDGSYHADSTPIILDLEMRHAGRSILPPSPAIRFLADLLEDIADEYLPFPMFYFRWTDDAEWCARRQMTGWSGALDDATLDAYARNFIERQQGQLGALKALPRETVLASYHGFLDAMEAQLRRNFFLFGSRPSIAEFGLYGQLSQYAIDPFVSNVMKERAVRTFQWTWFMDDLSGIDEGAWFEPSACLTPELERLLAATAPMYFMMANRLIAQHGLDDDGSGFNGPRYRIRTYLNLKRSLSALTESDRALIRPLLEASGCWAPLQFAGDEASHVRSIGLG